jgi:hypothetical protein
MVFLPLGHLYNTEQDKNNHHYISYYRVVESLG